ncbi:MAG: ABC transporter ATP-binding protein [Microbacteriaceae bacterium]|nr:ABC transporter ATP-binding protein [Microbacteriaceae bacterium]
MSAILEARGLSRAFGGGETRVDAVTDVSLTVEPGELVLLRGPSGSGKTTLLNMLGGLDRPTAGSVTLDGAPLSEASEDELADIRRRDIGFVFQSFALLPVLSAAENVEVPLRILRTPAQEREERVAELLDAVGLGDHANQRPYELSGGQQQRVGIARALANRPRVLIADEPTGQLDSGTALAMMALISRLVHEQGVAAIISTHDPRMSEHADRVLQLHDGRLAG